MTAGLPASAACVSAGPRPPLRVSPWHEPQSWVRRCISSVCRAAGISAQTADVHNAPSAARMMPVLCLGLRMRTRSPGKTGRDDSRPLLPVSLLVDVVLRVIDVELARRRDQSLVLDHGLELARLVVDNHDGGFLVLAIPDGKPDLVAALVVFRLHDTLRSLAQAGHFRNLDDLVTLAQVVDVIDGGRLADGGIGIQRRIHPQVSGLGMGLDEEGAAPLSLEAAHDLS